MIVVGISGLKQKRVRMVRLGLLVLLVLFLSLLILQVAPVDAQLCLSDVERYPLDPNPARVAADADGYWQELLLAAISWQENTR